MLTKIIILTLVIIYLVSTKVIKRAKNNGERQSNDVEKEPIIGPMSSNGRHTQIPRDFYSNTTVEPHNIVTIQQPKQSKPKKKSQEKAKTVPKSSVNRPNIDSNEAEENTFDLKKAVVYSEILHPKYKDYEN